MRTKRIKAPATSPSLQSQLRFNEAACSNKKGEAGFDFFGGDSVLLGELSLPVQVASFRPIYIFNENIKGHVWVSLSGIPLRNIAAPGIPGVSRVGGIVTVTTTVAHDYIVGDTVELIGVTNPTFDGPYTISSVPTSFTFTYAQALVNASSGNGTVGMPLPGIGTGILVPQFQGIILASGENTWLVAGASDVYGYQASDNILE